MTELTSIGRHKVKNFSKGKIIIYDPELRQIITEDEIIFDYVPNDVVVKYNPNFEFLSAPQGLRNFAQFGSTKPRTISFTLFYAGNVNFDSDIKYIDTVQQRLKKLVTPRLMPQTATSGSPNVRLAPPLVRLVMGNIVQDAGGKLPIGVISSLSFKGLSVSSDLNLNRFEADIEFTESTTDFGQDFDIKILTTQQGKK
jgi:hypothetical protein